MNTTTYYTPEYFTTRQDFERITSPVHDVADLTQKQMRFLKSRYHYQAHRSLQRGVDFCLTFSEWLNIWLESGKLHLRGNYGPTSYVMGRHRDSGAYVVGNVEIITHSENVRLARIYKNTK